MQVVACVPVADIKIQTQKTPSLQVHRALSEGVLVSGKDLNGNYFLF